MYCWIDIAAKWSTRRRRWREAFKRQQKAHSLRRFKSKPFGLWLSERLTFDWPFDSVQNSSSPLMLCFAHGEFERSRGGIERYCDHSNQSNHHQSQGGFRLTRTEMGISSGDEVVGWQSKYQLQGKRLIVVGEWRSSLKEVNQGHNEWGISLNWIENVDQISAH